MKKTVYTLLPALLLLFALPLAGYSQDALCPQVRSLLKNRAARLRNLTPAPFAPGLNNPAAQVNQLFAPAVCTLTVAGTTPGGGLDPSNYTLIYYKYNTAGQCTSDAWYYHNGMMSFLSDSTYFHEYTYDAFGNVDSVYTKKWKPTQRTWVADSLVTYSYDGNNNFSEWTISYYDTSARNWVQSEGGYFSYLYPWAVTRYEHYYSGGVDHFIAKDSIVSFKPSGEPIEEDVDVQAFPIQRFKTIYSGWHNWVNHPYRYFGGFPTGYNTQRFKNGVFINSSREFTSYVGNTNLIDSLYHEQADTGGVYNGGSGFDAYLNITKNFYTYNGNNNISRISVFGKTSLIGNLSIQRQYDYSNFIPLGVAVSSSKAGFSAYPNPFNNSLVVNVQAPAAYTVTDLSGKVLMQGQLLPENGRATLATETLPAGMYLLHAAGSVLKVVKE